MNRQQVVEQRRHQGEENYRKKFEEFGLSERFEFIRRDWNSDKGQKIFVRCQICGAEFSTWQFNEMLRGRTSHLICSECGAASDGADIWVRSSQCDEAMVYYTQGHTVAETAEKFGVSKCQINNAVKTRGVTNGKDWREAGINSARQRGEQIRKAREAERARIKAERRRQTEERRQQREIEKERIAREIARERARAKADHEAEIRLLKEEQLHKRFRQMNEKAFVCTVCGRNFSISEYVESEGLTLIPTNPKYCSHECKRKTMNRLSKANKRARGVRDTHRHRARKYGCAYDSSVTLAKLIKRDGLKCAICGKPCDPNDHSWYKYSGPMYPSIDHILPMSKGGGHVWSNVQVAHIICNSEKGDRNEGIKRKTTSYAGECYSCDA